jgi:hypothetical protein
VTLSICGLGFMDESEIDSIPNSTKVDVFMKDKKEEIKQMEPILRTFPLNDPENMLDNFLKKIVSSDSLEDLQSIFSDAKKCSWPLNLNALNQIIDAKNERKNFLETLVKEFNEEIESAEGAIE